MSGGSAVESVGNGQARLDEYKGFGDYAAEMRGLSKACGLQLGDVVAGNLVYQLEGIGVNCSNWNNTGPTGAALRPPPIEENVRNGFKAARRAGLDDLSTLIERTSSRVMQFAWSRSLPPCPWQISGVLTKYHFGIRSVRKQDRRGLDGERGR